MYYTCKCCKEICNESKKHDFMNDDYSRLKVGEVYPVIKNGTFAGTTEQLVGKTCKECFMAFKEFEFDWQEQIVMEEMLADYDYESWKEQGCERC